MGNQNMYHLCCKHQGKMVRITEHCGRVHVGRITGVDRRMVYIQPHRGFGGYGFGYWGWGRPYGYGGLGYGVALGAIAGVALAGAFFW